MAGSPNASLPPARFLHLETYDVNGAAVSVSTTQTITQTDLQASTRTRVRTEDLKAGALAFLGIGSRKPSR